MYVLGIDFGHGETSAAVVNLDENYDQTILSDNLNIYGNKKSIHSAIYKNELDEWCLNPDPSNLANSSEFRMYFKGSIAQLDDANREYYTEFIRLTYNQIIRRAQDDNNYQLMSEDGQPNFKLYLACPSGWSDQERQEYKSFFENILHVPIVSVIPESEAALTYSRHSDRSLANQLVKKRKILIIDFGSSTIDFTLMSDGNVQKNATIEYGAKNVEEIIFQHMIQHEQNALNAYQCLVNHGLNEIFASQELVFIVRKEKEEYYGNRNRMYMGPSLDIGYIIQDATERFRCDNIRGYSSEELNNNILTEYINNIRNCFSNFNEDNDCAGLEAVILTGGASNMDFVQSLANEVFGLKPMMAPDPSLNISQGIAVYGYLNEKGRIAPPDDDGMDDTDNDDSDDTDTFYSFPQCEFKAIFDSFFGSKEATVNTLKQAFANNYKIVFNKCIDDYCDGKVIYCSGDNKELEICINAIKRLKKHDNRFDFIKDKDNSYDFQIPKESDIVYFPDVQWYNDVFSRTTFWGKWPEIKKGHDKFLPQYGSYPRKSICALSMHVYYKTIEYFNSLNGDNVFNIDTSDVKSRFIQELKKLLFMNEEYINLKFNLPDLQLHLRFSNHDKLIELIRSLTRRLYDAFWQYSSWPTYKSFYHHRELSELSKLRPLFLNVFDEYCRVTEENVFSSIIVDETELNPFVKSCADAVIKLLETNKLLNNE